MHDAMSGHATPAPQQQTALFEFGHDQARAGVQEVFASFGAPLFTSCPEEWTRLPFARICWHEEEGDQHLGVPESFGWTLAADQRGTVIERLADAHLVPFAPGADVTPRPQEVLADPAASGWLKFMLREALQRDPVDAANDAEVLARLLAERAEAAQLNGEPELQVIHHVTP